MHSKVPHAIGDADTDEVWKLYTCRLKFEKYKLNLELTEKMTK